jgi:tetratricopeptide (TPR) repeat protein
MLTAFYFGKKILNRYLHKNIPSPSLSLSRDVQAYVHKILSLISEHKYLEAIPYVKKALALEPTNVTIIDYAAIVHVYASQLEPAIAYFKQLLEIEVSSKAQVYYNLAFAYTIQGKTDEAIEALKKAITLQPNYKMAHSLLGEIYLSLGKFKEGWHEFAWHWWRKFSPGILTTMDLKGKTIVIHDVQGIGDSLQLIRYLKILKERGAHTVLNTQFTSLIPLYSSCTFIDKIITNQADIPPCDFKTSMMALPLTFNEIEATIPHEIPYLKADPKLVQHWKLKLAHDKNFKIGICWHADLKGEFEKPILSRKSIPLLVLSKLMKMSGASFYSLQKIHGLDQIKSLPSDSVLHQFNDDFDESNGRFMDTAALMMNLDLIISVDTSVAHLAGALGRPVWLMVPFPADWRWMLNRDDSPWYPTLKIFRQSIAGDWDSLVEHMKLELEKKIADLKK